MSSHEDFFPASEHSSPAIDTFSGSRGRAAPETIRHVIRQVDEGAWPRPQFPTRCAAAGRTTPPACNMLRFQRKRRQDLRVFIPWRPAENPLFRSARVPEQALNRQDCR